MQHSTFRLAALSLILATGLWAGGCQEPQHPGHDHQQKQVITRLDQLPQHTYPVDEPLIDMLQDDEAMMGLAAAVRRDTEDMLENYEIPDDTTIQRLHGALMTADLVQGDTDAALGHLERMRELEDKEASRLTMGMALKARLAARQATNPEEDFEAYRKAYKAALGVAAAKLPWDVVQDEIKSSRSQAEIFSDNLLMGVIKAQLQPVVDETGELSRDQATSLLSMYQSLKDALPLKEETVAVYSAIIDANRIEKENIWPEREVALTRADPGKPVLMGVWDSGTDTDVFFDQLWINTNDPINGRDDDMNGYVDDVYGIAYDIHANKSRGMLTPLGDSKDRIGEVMAYMKGFMDLRSAIDSPEAAALRQHLATLAPEDVQGFIEDLGLAGNYAHGTHVAGLMAAGDPFARLLIARLSYDHHVKPVARTIAWGQRDARKMRDTVDYFLANGVRVVNMSWGEAMEDAESSLERNGIGKSAEERRVIAKQVFKLQKDALYESIQSAPDILFVAAAGNADNDVQFDDYIPSGFDLPNLLVVGAVDQAGEPTSFTSFGPTVQVYANGFEVESYVPGGQRMAMSGTSMASPNAANLAGKLLALDPTLTPPQVIELIKEGADEQQYGEQTFLLMNPKQSVALLKERMNN